MGALGSAARFFTVRPAELGLPAAYEAPETLYHHDRMSAIRRAIAETFSGPLYYAVEVGGECGGGRLHIHAVAHAAARGEISAVSEACKPIYDPVGLWAYLGKPPERWNMSAELEYRGVCALAPNGRAPKTRGHLYGSERLAWATHQRTAADASQCTKHETFSVPPLFNPFQDPARVTLSASQPLDNSRENRSDPLLVPAVLPLDPARADRGGDHASQRPRTGVRMVPTASFSYAVHSLPPATPQKLVRIPPKPLPARIVQALRR
jgi:hypothetical protein